MGFSLREVKGRGEMGSAKVHLDVNEVGQGTIMIDGQDMSSVVRSVELKARAGEKTSVTFEVIPVVDRWSVEALDVVGRLKIDLDLPTMGQLKMQLRLIEAHDENYGLRYQLVLSAVAMAVLMGLKAGFRFDPAEPEWPVAYIELPTGQVSWHVPQHETAWDDHSTEEKYGRVNAFIRGGVRKDDTPV